MKIKPVVITEKMRRQIAGAVAEIDLEQMKIVRKLTPAARVQMAASMIDAAERVGAYRLRRRDPTLSEEDALRIIRGGLLEYQIKKQRWREHKSDS